MPVNINEFQLRPAQGPVTDFPRPPENQETLPWFPPVENRDGVPLPLREFRGKSAPPWAGQTKLNRIAVNKVVAAFGGGGLNCAQSVLRGFQDEKGISDESISAAGAFGRGRAAEGLCGALHAALELSEEQMRGPFRESFKEVAGSGKCREIRKKRQLSCSECIELAAQLLMRNRNESGGQKSRGML